MILRHSIIMVLVLVVSFLLGGLVAEQKESSGGKTRVRPMQIDRERILPWFGSALTHSGQYVQISAGDNLSEALQILAEEVTGEISSNLNRVNVALPDDANVILRDREIYFSSHSGKGNLEKSVSEFVTIIAFYGKYSNVRSIKEGFKSKRISEKDALRQLLVNDFQILNTVRRFYHKEWKVWCKANDIVTDFSQWGVNNETNLDVWLQSEYSEKRAEFWKRSLRVWGKF